MLTELWTPVGLRSLAPRDSRYIGRYGGGPWSATPLITRAPCGPGCWARWRPRTTAFTGMPPRRSTCCEAYPRICVRPASGRSARSWTGIRHSRREAASRRPGEWPRFCGLGARSRANRGSNHECRKAASRRMRFRAGGMEEVGALSERTSVGHGARRLQPPWQCLGLLPARSCPQPGLPLGRGRHRRLLGRSTDAVPVARALERTRPDPEGTPVRSDQRRRQPWRGREGALLLSRCHADALLFEDVVQVSAGSLSLRRPGRREPRRGAGAAEYELLDTGVFDDDRYFDVVVEYAQAQTRRRADARHRPNRGGESAPLHILPQLLFRNSWSWKRQSPKPLIRARDGGVVAEHEQLGAYHCQALGENGAEGLWLFTENETNVGKLHAAAAAGPFKDAFHD